LINFSERQRKQDHLQTSGRSRTSAQGFRGIDAATVGRGAKFVSEHAHVMPAPRARRTIRDVKLIATLARALRQGSGTVQAMTATRIGKPVLLAPRGQFPAHLIPSPGILGLLPRPVGLGIGCPDDVHD
jgi:hypothetical protein